LCGCGGQQAKVNDRGGKTTAYYNKKHWWWLESLYYSVPAIQDTLSERKFKIFQWSEQNQPRVSVSRCPVFDIEPQFNNHRRMFIDPRRVAPAQGAAVLITLFAETPMTEILAYVSEHNRCHGTRPKAGPSSPRESPRLVRAGRDWPATGRAIHHC